MDQPDIDAQITFLYVRDLEASARFYAGALGLPLAVDQGSCRIYRVCGRKAYLGICLGETNGDRGDALIFTLVVSDVDGLHRRLLAAGYSAEHAPRVNERYRIYHFFVRDPDGYRLEVQRFLDEAWDKST